MLRNHKDKNQVFEWEKLRIIPDSLIKTTKKCQICEKLFEDFVNKNKKCCSLECEQTIKKCKMCKNAVRNRTYVYCSAGCRKKDLNKKSKPN